MNDSLPGHEKLLPILYKLLDLTEAGILKWEVETHNRDIYATLCQKHNMSFSGMPILIKVIRRPERNDGFAIQVSRRMPIVSGGIWFYQTLFTLNLSNPLPDRNLVSAIQEMHSKETKRCLKKLNTNVKPVSSQQEAHLSAREILKQLQKMQTRSQ